MKMKRTVLTPVVVALVALGTGGWFLQRGVDQEQNVYANAKLFEDVLHRVASSFVDKKDTGELYRKAIDGMLEELGDPHSTFMAAKDYEALRTETEGEYGGIGIQIGRRGDYVTVISPLPGTPGERLGLRAGDAIIEVDGESAKGWSEDQAMSKLRGPVGKSVNMTVARPGVADPIPFKIVREEIHIRAVPAAYMLDNGVGYVEMVIFSESSTDELRAAIKDLRAKGAKGVILDLRRNPGGLLDQGSSVSDLFLDRGKVIVETKSRLPTQNQQLVAQDADEFPGMPLVVLTGRGTASASEIVAGALQDHDRALVVGVTSYGKGSVQTLFPLADDNYLKLTTARWYTPSGRSIQKPYGIGATADAESPAPDAGLTSADSTKDKPKYKTDSGRTVYGGGGIIPDLVVSPDTLTAEERAFYQEIVSKYGQQFTTGRLAFAVDYIRRNPSLERGFAN